MSIQEPLAKKDRQPPHVWTMSSPELALPNDAGVGRLQRFAFSSGFYLYRSEFRVDKTCTIDASTPELFSFLCTQMLLAGRLLYGGSSSSNWLATDSNKSAMLYRIDRPGIKLTMPGGQIVRHVGVASKLEHIIERFGGSTPEGLECFIDMPDNGSVIKPLYINRRLRRLATEAFGSHHSDPLEHLALEGLAICFYTEFVSAFIKAQSGLRSDRHWEKSTFTALLKNARDNLAKPLPAAEVANLFSLSPHRLNTLFQSNVNCSYTEFLRRERLQKARELIENTDMPVKTVSHAVGYNHVSNFSKAYRQFFGETPGHTQRLSDKHK